MTHRRLTAAWLSILLGLTLPLAAFSETEPQALDGRWRLDWDRSESFASALEAMEVGWFMRQLAGVARVDIAIQSLEAECADCPSRLELTFSSPISNRSEVVFLDGRPRPGKDPQGNDTLDRYRLTDTGGVERVRELELPSGRAARLVETPQPGRNARLDDLDTRRFRR